MRPTFGNMSPEGRNIVVLNSDWVSIHRRRVDSADPEDSGCFQAGVAYCHALPRVDELRLRYKIIYL